MAITKASEVIQRLNDYSQMVRDKVDGHIVIPELHRSVTTFSSFSDNHMVTQCRNAMVALWSKYGMEPMGASDGVVESNNGGYVFGKDGKTMGVVFHYESRSGKEIRPYICISTPFIDKERKPTDLFRSNTVEGLMSILKRDNGSWLGHGMDQFASKAATQAVYSIQNKISVGSMEFSFSALDSDKAIDLVNLFTDLEEGKSFSPTDKLSAWVTDTRERAATVISNRREHSITMGNFMKGSLVISEIPYVCEHKYLVQDISIAGKPDLMASGINKTFRINEIKELVTEYPYVFGVHNLIRAKGTSSNEGLFSGDYSWVPTYVMENNLIRMKLHNLPHMFYPGRQNCARSIVIPKTLQTSQEKEEARSDESFAPSVVAVARTKSEFF